MKTILRIQINYILCIVLLMTSCSDGSKKLFDSANSKSSRGDHKGAILEFDKALQLNPSKYLGYYERGMAKLKLEDYEGAINDMNLELKNNSNKGPNNSIVYFARAQAKSKIGDFHGAIRDYDTTILVNKNFPPIVFAYRGATKHIIGDQIGGIKDMKKADSLGYIPYIPEIH
jgi:tetratricopeptide (TPR) repeat protein